MNSLSRRRRDGWMRFFRRTPPSCLPDAGRLLDRDQFQLAIRKERARSERRDLVFSLIRMDAIRPATEWDQPALAEVLKAFSARLRITDELGLLEHSLGILLPETIPDDAARIAHELTELAVKFGQTVSTDILVWPETEDGNPAGPARSESSGIAEAGPVSRVAPDEGSPVAMIASRSRTAAKSQNTLRVRTLDLSRPVPWWKRSMDLVGAGAALVLLSPLMLAAAIAVRLSSPGPIVFAQWREGKDGRLFRIYKFRTMRDGADEEKHLFRPYSEQDGPAFKIKNDPRLTLVGKYLRKSCVDELPQLINVLRGEMSLVGPRPLPAEESLDCMRWQRRRLDVLPGMTCTWQVCGGREMPFDEWMRMDIRYSERIGLAGDVKLLLRTVLVSVLHRGSV